MQKHQAWYLDSKDNLAGYLGGWSLINLMYKDDFFNSYLEMIHLLLDIKSVTNKSLKAGKNAGNQVELGSHLQ